MFGFGFRLGFSLGFVLGNFLFLFCLGFFCLFCFCGFVCGVVLCERITVIGFAVLSATRRDFESDYAPLIIAVLVKRRNSNFIGLGAEDLFALFGKQSDYLFHKAIADTFVQLFLCLCHINTFLSFGTTIIPYFFGFVNTFLKNFFIFFKIILDVIRLNTKQKRARYVIIPCFRMLTIYIVLPCPLRLLLPIVFVSHNNN